MGPSRLYGDGPGPRRSLIAGAWRCGPPPATARGSTKNAPAFVAQPPTRGRGAVDAASGVDDVWPLPCRPSDTVRLPLHAPPAAWHVRRDVAGSPRGAPGVRSPSTATVNTRRRHQSSYHARWAAVMNTVTLSPCRLTPSSRRESPGSGDLSAGQPASGRLDAPMVTMQLPPVRRRPAMGSTGSAVGGPSTSSGRAASSAAHRVRQPPWQDAPPTCPPRHGRIPTALIACSGQPTPSAAEVPRRVPSQPVASADRTISLRPNQTRHHPGISAPYPPRSTTTSNHATQPAHTPHDRPRRPCPCGSAQSDLAPRRAVTDSTRRRRHLPRGGGITATPQRPREVTSPSRTADPRVAEDHGESRAASYRGGRGTNAGLARCVGIVLQQQRSPEDPCWTSSRSGHDRSGHARRLV